MSKHTPGPWTAEWHLETRHPKDHPQWHVEDGLDCVADVYGGGANARLIAAAPDLLAALKLFMRDPNHYKAYDAGKAAIAKAEGTP